LFWINSLINSLNATASGLQDEDQLLNLNMARIRDVELLTGLEFLRSVESAQDAIRIRVSASDKIW